MKRLISIMLTIALMLMLPVAFADDEPMFTTMAEVLDESVSTGSYGWWGTDFIAIATVDGKYYRVFALVDDETAKQIDKLYEAIDYSEAEEQMDEIALTLPVAYIEDISVTLKDQAELDALVGKTIGELTDAGWQIAGYGVGDTVDFTLRYGLFEYTFEMNDSVELFEERYDTEDFSDFTIKSVRLEGVAGIALEPDYAADGTYAPKEQDSDEQGSFSVIMELLVDVFTAIENGDEIDWQSIVQRLTEAYPEVAEIIESVWEIITEIAAEEAVG